MKRRPFIRFAGRVALVVLLALTGATREANADDAWVPVPLQAQLIAKIADYDRNFAARAGDSAVILLLTGSHPDSVRVASQMTAALSDIGRIGGRPHEEITLAYPGATELATLCQTRKVAIVYFGPGFRREIEAIRRALDGVNVLSFSGTPEDVPMGIVLGVDLVAGKPKLLVHLTQARRQNVALSADILKLMKVYE